MADRASKPDEMVKLEGIDKTPAGDGSRSGLEAREREMVRRCVEGDTTAWRALYDRHFPDVERLVASLGIVDAEADDICQEIFVIIYRNLARFRGIARAVADTPALELNVGSRLETLSASLLTAVG